MNKRTQSTDRSSAASFSSGSTLRSRHHYSTTSRAKEATEVLNTIVEAASSSTVCEPKRRSPGRDLGRGFSHQSVVTAGPFFSNLLRRPPTAQKKDSDLDLELRTDAGSSVRNLHLAGRISDDDDDIMRGSTEYPPFSHRKGNPVLKVEDMQTHGPAAAAAIKRQTNNVHCTTMPTSEPLHPVIVNGCRPTTSSNQVNPPSSSTLNQSSLSDSSRNSAYSAHTYNRALADARNPRQAPKKEQLQFNDLGSDVGSQGHSLSIPAASDSYINRNNYVTKPRWGLSSDDLYKQGHPMTENKKNVPQEKLSGLISKKKSDSAGPRYSHVSVTRIDDDLYTLDTSGNSKTSAFVRSTLGQKMDSLSMEKVFNDPSFHGIYEQYNKNKKKGPPTVTQSEPVQTGKPSRPGHDARQGKPDGIELVRMLKKPETQYSVAIRHQIPTQLAILDSDILTLLSDEVLKQNPLLQKLQNACFRKRADGTIECLSIMDLGLEKKDHEFLTTSWMQLAKMTENCRHVYDIIYASKCGNTKFLRNIMTFMKNAVNQGLELATLLIKTATFVVVRDGQPADLLNFVHQVRQLTETLNNNAGFIETVRNALTENFSAIPLVTSGSKIDFQKQEFVKNRVRDHPSRQCMSV